MIEIVVYFGIAQSIFAAVLMLTKRPVSIADKISAAWLFTMSYSFIINVIKIRYEIIVDFWAMSIIPVLTYTQFLFLYTKYISIEYDKFQKRDYFHFLPFLGGIIYLIILYVGNGFMDFKSFACYSNQMLLPRHVMGNAFIVCLWIYSIATFIRIRNYRKQIADFYSFESRSINLNWLLFLSVSFFVVYHIIILASFFHIKGEQILFIELFRSGALLFFVYVLSFGGIRQQQLTSEEKPIKITTELSFHETISERYKKSGLKAGQAEVYSKKLIDYMTQSEAWKDNELSVAKLSEQTDIPKYYITQILNEKLQKNFYTFVNEYRTEYAKQLIKSPKYANWSLLAIAYECGFNSKSAFNNFFKKYCDMTPSEYKNQI